MDDFLYLDYNATTPVDPRVSAVMLAALQENYGNPSSGHRMGRAAREAVERARAQVAALIGAKPEEILFTSGGTESSNMVILDSAARTPPGREHLLISAVEHPATVEPARGIESKGWKLSMLPVDEGGRVDPSDLAQHFEDDPPPALVSVMLANNEVGSIQPIADLAAICREHGTPLHSDAAQAVGKIPVDVEALGVDFLSIAGHKFYGPKGVGALYIREGREFAPLLTGADQEAGRRAGTENVPGIVGLGEAARLSEDSLEEEMEHSRYLRDLLLITLRQHFDTKLMRCNGLVSTRPQDCLPGTLSISFPGLNAGDLLADLGDRLAASAGAACNRDGAKISATLAAMGVPAEQARGTLRLSVGRMSREAEILEGADLISAAVRARLG